MNGYASGATATERPWNGGASDKTAPRRALVVRLSSIGDVVHTVPAYMALRAAWPDTELGWVVEPAAAPLIRRLPGRPAVHVVDTQRWRRRPLRVETWRHVQQARHGLRDAGYELAIDFQGLIKSALVARSGAPRTFGLAAADLREPLAARFYDEAAPPSNPDAHVIDRSLRLAAAVAGTPTDSAAARPSFPALFDSSDAAAVDARLHDLGIDAFAIMHGVANWQSKTWPAARYAAVARGLHQRTGLTVLWTWGPGEESVTRKLARDAGEGNRASFATSLPELAALLRRARLFVGGDSAPLHLAVAAGTPTVGIFGPTSPYRFGPLDALDGIAVSKQPCSWCQRRRCPLGTRACLETLSADTVLDAALARLEKTPSHAA